MATTGSFLHVEPTFVVTTNERIRKPTFGSLGVQFENPVDITKPFPTAAASLERVNENNAICRRGRMERDKKLIDVTAREKLRLSMKRRIEITCTRKDGNHDIALEDGAVIAFAESLRDLGYKVIVFNHENAHGDKWKTLRAEF